MKKEIEVKVCCGTNCYIMGGSELHLIKEHLTEEIAQLISLKGENCSGNCHDFSRTQKPPLAWINGEMIENASIEKLKKEIVARSHK
ncbi:NADH-quinone oxidoreductase subunit NuoE family protein [Labilibacter marinus]|uniref:hypothetical protein n=1 Tax=Labilibacter marinus TaxID=1477105 RepID=UPI00094F7DF7|nr:hypothetical protein [Labilibacter marinus]